MFVLFKYFVIADLQTILHTKFFGTFIISYIISKFKILQLGIFLFLYYALCKSHEKI